MKKANYNKFITNELDFDKLLNNHNRVMALIFASWCPFCVRFLPIFEKQAQQREDLVMVQDNQEIIADKYEVNVVPTVLFFEKGQLIKRLDGVLGIGLNEKQLHDFIDEC